MKLFINNEAKNVDAESFIGLAKSYLSAFESIQSKNKGHSQRIRKPQYALLVHTIELALKAALIIEKPHITAEELQNKGHSLVNIYSELEAFTISTKSVDIINALSKEEQGQSVSRFFFYYPSGSYSVRIPSLPDTYRCTQEVFQKVNSLIIGAKVSSSEYKEATRKFK